MRTQATVIPTFWTGESGVKLRGNSDAQVLALYLMTSPHSSYIGLYHESLPSILHETGLTEERFRAALPAVAEIALYDEQRQLVFLPEGAKHQIGETLSVKDNKRKAILSQLKLYKNHDFVRQWIERYHTAYNLSHEGIRQLSTSPFEAPSKPLRSPFEAPSKPLSQAPSKPLSQAPETKTDPEADPDPRSALVSGAETPMVASLQVRAQTWVADPFRATMSYPDPHTWTEMLELVDLVATTFAIEPDVLRPPSSNGSLDSRVAAVLERWAEGVDQARMRQAIRGSKHNDLIAGKPELQSLATIFKDGNAVDKYCRLAKNGHFPAAEDKSNRRRLTPEAEEKRRKFLAGE